jgi:prepilin-type processing-associated H-X9-DG protein
MYYNENQCYPPHKWKLPNGTSDRWPTAVALYLRTDKLQRCPTVPNWQTGRNNAYGYNYKYLGSLRNNHQGPTVPYERFPVTTIANPGHTIAYADTDGTGWTKPYDAAGKDVDAIGNHGYTLDPTFIPKHALTAVNNNGVAEAYAYLNHRTYISTRHRNGSNVVWLDTHVEHITPRQAYRTNRFWNGIGQEDPTRDDHVSSRVGTGTFRFAAQIK